MPLQLTLFELCNVSMKWTLDSKRDWLFVEEFVSIVVTAVNDHRLPHMRIVIGFWWKAFLLVFAARGGCQFSLAVIMCIMHGQKKDMRVSCFACACRNLPVKRTAHLWYQKGSTDLHHLQHWESTIKAPRVKWPQTNPRWSATNPPTAVSGYLCLSLTAKQIKTVAKIRSQICTSGQIYVSPASAGTTATNQDSHIRVLLASLQKFALQESIAHVCCMCFFLFSFFGCMMVRCVALILLLVAKGGCLQKSDLLLCLYKAKFVMQDSETEGRAFVVP
jgi:hypothetical protein